MRHTVIYRAARKEDSHRIAELDNLASGGTLDFLFHDLIPGMTPVQIVANGLEDDHYPHSCRSVIVAEIDGRIVGMALSFPSKYHGITDELRNFLPPDRLEHFRDFFSSRVEGSYFLDALAVDDGYRRRGIGAELVGRTIKRAEKEGFSTVSLIVFCDNEKATSLYTRLGFVPVKQIRLDRHPLIPHDGGCLLMKYAPGLQ